ncbi:MAG: hypothetical protein JXM79_01230 [Sedimentisphaerales bacterium]|nr:hypothetical protein [Sedimentisphaerales bacterium]
MCKKIVILTSIVMLALAGHVMAQIDPVTVDDGHVYLFDNVSGAQVEDDSANNNAATIVGDPQTVEGMKSNALYFDGVDDGIHLADSDFINVNAGPFPNRTVVAVFKCDDVDKPGTKQTIFEEGGTTRGMVTYVSEGELYVAAWNRAEYMWDGAWLSTPILSNAWYAVAMIIRDGTEAVEDDKFEMWLNGQLIATAPGGHLHNHGDDGAIGYTQQNAVFHDGNASPADGHYFQGAIDEVWILNQALTQVELSQWAGKPWPYAFGPEPADGALHEGTWVNLSWTPGQLAVSHDIYMGVNLDDVNNATRDSEWFRGNQTTDFYVAGFPGFAYPEGLVPGTTYYWRIDEVNDADPESPWKGDVWRFSVPPLTAYDPDPADGLPYVNPDDVTLSWTPGFAAKLHYVYFGDDFDQVNNAAGALPSAETTYSPGALEGDTTYYWRIDEFDGFTTHKGDVWSFSTIPAVPMTDDPSLILWWSLNEGVGKTTVDWSGNGHHGALNGEIQWIEGYDLSALYVDGSGGDYVEAFDYEGITGTNPRTCCAWIRTDVPNTNLTIMSWGENVVGEKWRVRQDVTGGLRVEVNGGYHYGVTSIGDDAWHHVAVTFEDDGSPDVVDTLLYVDGQMDETLTSQSTAINTAATGRVRIGETPWHGAPWNGLIDDARIYNRVLTEEEIQVVMRIDPKLAWQPSPKDGSTPDIDAAIPLSWQAGDSASQHDVYFGLDEDAVENADSSDTTGVYRGRQSTATYTPSEGLEWGGGPYYWRVDEVNNDGTLTQGRIWSFSVADFILVDDFESYTDDDANGEAIWQHWIDGFGVATNGAQVGYLLPPYAEQTIINNGIQSMPFIYDNTAGVSNSEAVLTLTAPRNWSRHGLTDLSLWFRGYPGSVGSFVEGPVGTFTMTGSGTDIWNTADEFHYAFKTLTGPGTIVARVNSVTNTNVWAKAGVMIRETLDAGSKHAFVCITPGSGVAFQRRTDTDAAMTGSTEADITAPHWVKIERDVTGNFTASRSSNGTTWEQVAGAIPMNIPMTSNVYIGLALTSHNATATCEAVFSNVTTSGNVSGQWSNQDIGITSNAAEPMYVEIANTNGTSALVAQDDPAAATIDVWTEWRIPLQAFADQGVHLTDVDSIAIGLGSKAGVASAGGSGTIYVDDIRLYPPATDPQP